MKINLNCLPFRSSSPAFSWVRALISTIMHDIFNVHDTEVAICILLVLSKRTNGLNHFVNYMIVYEAITRHNSQL